MDGDNHPSFEYLVKKSVNTVSAVELLYKAADLFADCGMIVESMEIECIIVKRENAHTDMVRKYFPIVEKK